MKNGIKILKYCIALGIALVCVMFFITCKDPSDYFGTDLNDTTNPAKKGYGTISIQIAGKDARTIVPSTVFDKYVYTFTKTGGTPTVATPVNGYFTLEVGNYTVEVKAYIGAAEPYTLVASGEASFTISSGSNAPVTVYLNEVNTGGQGKLTYTITYPAGAAAEISLNKWPDLIDIALNPSPSTQGNGKTQTLQLNSGSYLLTVIVGKNGLYGGISEALHIYPALLTEYTKNFLDNDLLQSAGAAVSAPTTSSVTYSSITINAVAAPGNGQTVEYAICATATAPIFGWQDSTTFSNLVANTTYYIFARSKENANYIAGTASTALQVTTPDAVYSVTNGNDSGTGSLRQAIWEVPNGGTIVVDSSRVTTIQLTTSPIYIVNPKKFVLEGNGVTITSSRPDGDYDEPLFYLSSDVEATIRRVHFTDIKVPAITVYYGNLINIESCIFSNAVNSNYPAITCFSGTMNIKGSTFYNNSGNSGKVIFAGGSVTLTGNLFYGNTATANNLPLARALYGGTVTSYGYNMVDVPLGTGFGQSGWNRQNTDKTISSIPVLPLNFKLLSGSEAQDFITSRPDGYPTVDFYGNAIPSSKAAAGAVQDAASSGFLVELSVNNSALGNAKLSSTTARNDDGLYPGGSITFTATPEAGCELQYWMVNNQQNTNNPLTLSLNTHYKVQAVFERPGIDLVSLTNAAYKDYAIEARLGASEWSSVTSQSGYGQVLRNISNKVYEKFKDDFDFIFFVLNTKEDNTITSALGFAGVNMGVSNNVRGLGKSPFDNTSSYGSAGKLKSVMYFPFHDAIRRGPALHEIAHNWAAYICPTYNLGNAGDIRYDGHWGVSNAGGQLGGFKYVRTVTSSGGVTEYQGSMDGTFTDGFGVNANGGNGVPYSDIELYLMGMIGAQELREEDFRLDIYTGLSSSNTSGRGYFKATGKTSYSIDDLIALNGPRIPDSLSSQKNFKVLTVILSKSQDATAGARYDEIVNNLKWFAGESKIPLLYNFNEATRGKGSLEVGGITKSLKP